MSERFNPLDMDSLAESIVQRMMKSIPMQMNALSRFEGAGIYAIYYVGDFPAYRIVRDRNINGRWSLPIYVGKAVSPGSRRGVDASQTVNTALWARLNEHVSSIESAENLEIADFYVRWLILDDIWIALGESALLRDLRPVWNAMVDGFGNHDPGEGRYKSLAPQWDTLHPGRSWAAKLQPRDAGAAEMIANDAVQYLRSRHS